LGELVLAHEHPYPDGPQDTVGRGGHHSSVRK
jgi:hypothetical protein